jgi:hypothetical protein
MCLRGRTGAHSGAQDHRRQVGAPSVQLSPVILCNFRPVLTQAVASGVRPRFAEQLSTLSASAGELGDLFEVCRFLATSRLTPTSAKPGQVEF